MTSTSDPGPEHPIPDDPVGTGTRTAETGPRVGRDELRDVARLRRPLDRKVAGVAAGLARHLDVDPLVLRVVFVVTAFFGGSGLLLYAALWLFLPEDGADQAPVHLDERSRGIAVVGAGVLAALLLLGDSWGLYWFPWPVALVAVAVWFAFFRDRSPARPAPTAPGTTTYDAAPASTYTGGYETGTYEWTAPRAPVSRPRNPRKRGPLLFWFTLALVALAEGVLGIVDLAGVDVLASAYPALALAIIGSMLVVGAFYGRAGGLILLGLIAATATAGTLAAERMEGEVRTETPTSAAAVESSYWMPAGELVLDLRSVADPEALDGRAIAVEGGVGRLEVVVPEDAEVRVEAKVDGPGSIRLFRGETGGIDVSDTATIGDGAGDAPTIVIDARLGVGEIVVRQTADDKGAWMR